MLVLQGVAVKAVAAVIAGSTHIPNVASACAGERRSGEAETAGARGVASAVQSTVDISPVVSSARLERGGGAA
jgi:hypothetical protein